MDSMGRAGAFLIKWALRLALAVGLFLTIALAQIASVIFYD